MLPCVRPQFTNFCRYLPLKLLPYLWIDVFLYVCKVCSCHIKCIYIYAIKYSIVSDPNNRSVLFPGSIIHNALQYPMGCANCFTACPSTQSSIQVNNVRCCVFHSSNTIFFLFFCYSCNIILLPCEICAKIMYTFKIYQVFFT